MTHRERVMAAVSHREPDLLPIDIGGHRDSSIHIEAYERLKKRLNVEAPVELVDRMQQAAKIDEAVLVELDVDTRGVYPGKPERNAGVTQEDGTWIDGWGVARHKPEGTKYYDQKNIPLAGEITARGIANYPWPDPADPGYVKGVAGQIERHKKSGDFALVLNLPAPIVHITQFLRGFEQWFMDLVLAPKQMGMLMDKCLEINMEIGRRVLMAAGKSIDIAMTADDMGAQDGMLFDPGIFRKLFKPRFKKYFDMIHKHSDARLLFHTCGSVYPILGDLADIGVDILNPVQPHAKDMSPARLKKEFGKDLAFWGAIDIQRVMSFGTPSEVRAEVAGRFEELGNGGGWVLSAAHNMQPETPFENILAMCGAAREIGRY